MLRGTATIYVTYTDYDEIAHHSGPQRAEALDALEDLDAVHLGKPDVQQDQVDRRRANGLQRARTVGDVEDLVGVLEHQAERLAYVRLVVHDEDDRPHRRLPCHEASHCTTLAVSLSGR